MHHATLFRPLAPPFCSITGPPFTVVYVYYKVDLPSKSDNTVPSLYFHYRSFIATTDCSAPVPGTGTFTLAAFPLSSRNRFPSS
jgi:hypothetical protein